MNELEKCMAGEYYNCHDDIFLNFKATARELLAKYNSLSYKQKTEKRKILEQLFGQIGANVSVGLPFICDYGRNIYLGSNVSVNMNCTFVDCNKITIGDGAVIGAGNVVTKNIPANTVAVGNPCRVIRKINENANNQL